MTTAEPNPTPPSAFARRRAAFRRWRHVRPFWGGLLTLLAGLEMFGTTQASLDGLSFQLGPTGFLSWLIPAILISCGLLIWFTPAQRMFYAIVAAITAVYSLIGVNLGGFFIGLLLGLIGSALSFAWVPAGPSTGTDGTDTDGTGTDGTDTDGTDTDGTGTDQAAPTAAGTAEVPVAAGSAPPATMDDLFTGPLTDTLPPARNPLRAPAGDETATRPAADAPTPVHPVLPASGGRDHAQTEGGPTRPGTVYRSRPTHLGDPARPGDPGATAPGQAGGVEPEAPGGTWGRRNPGALAILLVALSVAASTLVTAPAASPALAACPTPTATPASPPAAANPAPAPGAGPAATATATPTTTSGLPPVLDAIGDIVGGIVDGVQDLLGIPGAVGSTSPTPTPTLTATPTGGTAAPGPATPGRAEPGASACPTPTPSKPDKPLKVDKAKTEPGQPPVAEFSTLTGTKLTMLGLKMDGVAELPTPDGGTVRVLKFRMDTAVTDDFELRSPTRSGQTLLTKSKKLTVGVKEAKGKVFFYASRFSGALFNFHGKDIFPLTLTPEEPLLPDGLPFAVPFEVAFHNPQIQLVFVDTVSLTANGLTQQNV